VSSALEVGSARLPEEDPWARRAAPAVRAREALAPALPGLGIRYVILFKEADWRGDLPRLIGLAPLFDAPDLRLYGSAAPARIPTFPAPPLPAVAAGDVAVLGLVVAAVVGLGRTRRRRSVPSGETH
jgi:hypothetical protein